MKPVWREFPPTPCYYMTGEGLKEFPPVENAAAKEWHQEMVTTLVIAYLCGPWGRMLPC